MTKMKQIFLHNHLVEDGFLIDGQLYIPKGRLGPSEAWRWLEESEGPDLIVINPKDQNNRTELFLSQRVEGLRRSLADAYERHQKEAAEWYRIAMNTPVVIAKYQKSYWTTHQLLYQGWTRYAIRKHLGAPDWVRMYAEGHYEVERVKAAQERRAQSVRHTGSGVQRPRGEPSNIIPMVASA